MPRIISPAELVAQPWKNGGGVTHEIVRWPASPDPSAATGDYDVRISIADDRVAAPFSRFPGYRRWSFLAGPAPIVLDVEGTIHELTALGDHLDVGGDVAISCQLPAGPTRLLNILVRNSLAAPGGIVVGHGPCPQPIRFAYALTAMAWLAQDHAAVFDPPAHATLDRHAVWMT